MHLWLVSSPHFVPIRFVSPKPPAATLLRCQDGIFGAAAGANAPGLSGGAPGQVRALGAGGARGAHGGVRCGREASHASRSELNWVVKEDDR